MVTYTDRTYDEDNDAENNSSHVVHEHGGFGFDDCGPEQPGTRRRSSGRVRAPSGSWKRTRWRLLGRRCDDDATWTTTVADNVGEPVTATDADGDTPVYTLGGTDKDMFRIRTNGQIEVGAKAMLDYEKKNRYSVTVMADDGYGGSNSTASITVTIYVTDLDEAPEIMDRADRTADG